MLITRDVRLLTPLLAARLNNQADPPRREFNRMPDDGSGMVVIKADLPRWNWAFLEARDALSLDDVATSAIIPSHVYHVKSTSTYNRVYRRGREQMKDVFESISTGRTVTFAFTLSKHLPPGGDGGGRFNRPPDEDEFDLMLAHIGEHLGMSEWGHAYLYGRFSIKNALRNSQG